MKIFYRESHRDENMIEDKSSFAYLKVTNDHEFAQSLHFHL